MPRTVSIGTQDFEELITRNNFYVDKTLFIKEWWENDDKVTLITRPRRFGKTLNMNMLERFFSVKYEGQGQVFEGLDIWKEEKYRDLQDIYNPWSIINFLDERKLKPYWANTSSNGLVSSLIREGNRDIKMQFELLLAGKTIRSRLNEEMVFNQLSGSERAVWSLLLAAGYLKIIGIYGKEYELSLTNYEVRQTFEDMVRDWFDENTGDYNGFIKSLLSDDVESMNEYMNIVADNMFSSFDGGKKPSEKMAPERFYHGFVLGLLVDLADRYAVMSNRESGFGRYDVMLQPLNEEDDGIILEFKIHNPKKESSLEETVKAALAQIEEKKYEQTLLAQGIKKEHIRKYGFAFRGKEVLIG